MSKQVEISYNPRINNAAETQLTFDTSAFSHFAIDKLVLLGEHAVEDATQSNTKENQLAAFRAVNIAQAAMIAGGLVELANMGEVEGVAGHYQEFADYVELDAAAANLMPQGDNATVQGVSTWELISEHFQHWSKNPLQTPVNFLYYTE